MLRWKILKSSSENSDNNLVGVVFAVVDLCSVDKADSFLLVYTPSSGIMKAL